MLLSLDFPRALIAGSLFQLLMAIVAAVALSFFIYRRTSPVVQPSIRYLLAFLRALALLLIILALFELTLQSEKVHTTPPLLAVAVDQSASMQQKDVQSTRAEILQRILKEDFHNRLDKDLATRYYGFAAHTEELQGRVLDSLTFAGDATNITGALENINSQLTEENLAAILLLSDGNYTQGGDPGRYAAEIGVPIYTIGVGSPQPQTDIGISNVEANPFAFAGESTPIRITVRSTSGQREKIRLDLEGVTGEKPSVQIDLARGPLDSVIVLNYTPVQAGRQKLSVKLSPSGNDVNRANNRFTLYQDVLKSKTLIFILAGALSPDLSALHNHLRSDERFDLRLLVEWGEIAGLQTARNQALQDSIEQGDIFVLYNFPRHSSSPRTFALLQAALQKKPRPLVFISGRDPDWNRLKSLEPYMPIRTDVLDLGETEVTPSLTPSGQQHPVMQIPGSSIAAWNLLPPVYASVQLRSWWPDAEILARARPAGVTNSGDSNLDRWPLILVRNAETKSAAIMGYDLWRWHLMMAGIGNQDETYHHFLQNLVRWLQIDQSTDLIRIQTDQSTYHFGDEVRLVAQVVDAQFQPVDDAEIGVSIKAGESENSALLRSTASQESDNERGVQNGLNRTLYLTPEGKGHYSALFRPELAGDYQLRAEVRRNGQVVGEASHLFSVGSYNEELSDVALKDGLLRRLAALSGGAYAHADSAAALISRIHGASLHRTLTHDMEVWNRGKLLIAILLCLTLEWFIRRRKGML